MSGRPRLLDLFCCEGGASEGYRRAGFDVYGIDLFRFDLTFPWRVNYELIYVRGDWAGARTSTAVLRYPLSNRDASRIGHPTPKPIGLMGNLVDRAPAGVICDPFAGSGSTLIAAMQRGRRAIGVEFDERYCEIAARRLSQGVLDLDGVGA